MDRAASPLPVPSLASCTSSLSTGNYGIWPTVGQGQGDLFLLAVPLPHSPHVEGLQRHSPGHPPASTKKSQPAGEYPHMEKEASISCCIIHGEWVVRLELTAAGHNA